MTCGRPPARAGDVFFLHHLGGAQHALVFAFGEDHPLLGRRLGGGEDGLHHEAGAEDEAVQLIEIGFVILDRPGGDAGFLGRLGDRRRDAQDEALVEGRRDQIVGPEDRRVHRNRARGGDIGGLFASKTCDRLHRRHLHRFVDGARAAIQRAAEE